MFGITADSGPVFEMQCAFTQKKVIECYHFGIVLNNYTLSKLLLNVNRRRCIEL